MKDTNECKFKDNLIRLKEIDSTNLEAFRQGKERGKCAVLADFQTAGRGRLGRSFIAEAGKSILLSVFETEILSPELTAMTGVVICRILRTHGLNAMIKWPNDIQIKGKKICGILCEMKSNAVVIGIGLNLFQEDFGELNEIASSARLCGVDIDKELILEEILDGLDRMLKDYPTEKEKYRSCFTQNCNTLNKTIVIQENNKKTKAFVKGIDESFRLILELPDGSSLIKDSGEITICK